MCVYYGPFHSWRLCVCLCSCRLNLRELGPLAAHMRWFVWLMAAAGTIYVFNYHEKYVNHQTFLSMRDSCSLRCDFATIRLLVKNQAFWFFIIAYFFARLVGWRHNREILGAFYFDLFYFESATYLQNLAILEMLNFFCTDVFLFFAIDVCVLCICSGIN